jgi:hypothetical protein
MCLEFLLEFLEFNLEFNPGAIYPGDLAGLGHLSEGRVNYIRKAVLCSHAKSGKLSF